MFALEALLALCLLLVCSFSPGFFVIRRLRWSPMEKLCGSIALSLILIYLASWGIYYAGADRMRPQACWAVSIACAALGVVARRDIIQLFDCFRVRRAALGFSFLLGWTLLLFLIIRNYSGAFWFGDW